MAKEYKHAIWICLALSIIAAAGIAAGILLEKPLIIAIVLVPVIAYESYRTEGVFTKLASWGALVIICLEIYAIISGITFNIQGLIPVNFNIPGTLGANLPAALIGPVILVILSVYLFKQTAGMYTRWLSIIILVTSVALFYAVDPQLLGSLFNSQDLQREINEGIKRNIRK